MEKETVKQKVIREAWGEYWDSVKDHVDENGNVPCPKFDPEDWYGKLELYIEPKYGYNMEQVGYSAFRPYTIADIEDNNGWIRTDEQMPDEGKPIVYIDRYGHQRNGFLADTVFVSDTGWREDVETPTHWRPKEVYPKPIY